MVRKPKYSPPLYIGQSISIQPNYVVSRSEYNSIRSYNSVKQIANRENLKENKHNGKLSEKAKSRLRNAVNWLVVSAKYKRVWSKADNKAFWFKVNFITLTIPRQPEKEPLETLVKQLLHNFLVYSQKYFYLKNYVWKMEQHKDGRLHIHITSDTFIHWRKLRSVWNGGLRRNGLLDDYHAKHGHYDANSTDVHAVWKVNNIAAYITKYMAKDPELCSKYKGRIWSCNNELSDKNKCSVFIEPDVASEEMRWLAHKGIEYSKIETPPDSMGKRLSLGEIYFMSEKIWAELARGKIREAYNARRFEIRHNIFKPPPEYYNL